MDFVVSKNPKIGINILKTFFPYVGDLTDEGRLWLVNHKIGREAKLWKDQDKGYQCQYQMKIWFLYRYVPSYLVVIGPYFEEIHQCQVMLKMESTKDDIKSRFNSSIPISICSIVRITQSQNYMRLNKEKSSSQIIFQFRSLSRRYRSLWSRLLTTFLQGLHWKLSMRLKHQWMQFPIWSLNGLMIKSKFEPKV